MKQKATVAKDKLAGMVTTKVAPSIGVPRRLNPCLRRPPLANLSYVYCLWENMAFSKWNSKLISNGSLFQHFSPELLTFSLLFY